MDQGLLYAYPPLSLVLQVLTKIMREEAEMIMVVQPGLVSPGPAIAGGSPYTPTTEQESPERSQRGPPPYPDHTPPCGVETQWQTLQAEGVSDAAATTIGQYLRISSKALYLKKWKCSNRWCKARDIHPLTAL